MSPEKFRMPEGKKVLQQKKINGDMSQASQESTERVPSG